MQELEETGKRAECGLSNNTVGVKAATKGPYLPNSKGVNSQTEALAGGTHDTPLKSTF
jgi:hypothetical protein